MAIDLRKDKGNELPAIEGLHIYPIDIGEAPAAAEARFNESYMELKGHQHFLFILNDFSFARMEQLSSQEFDYCREFIRILNSYSFNYLAILEGGEEAYFAFLRQDRMKSELLNSKLVPVSELAFEEDGSQLRSSAGFLESATALRLSEIFALQRLYESRKLAFYEGTESSEELVLIVL